MCLCTRVPESLSYDSRMKSSRVHDPWSWGVDLERKPGLWQRAVASTAVEGRARERRSIHPDPIKAASECSQCCNCSAFQKSFDIVNQTYIKCTSHMTVCRQSFFERCTAAEQNNPQQASVHEFIEKPMSIDCKHNVVLGNLTSTC